MPNPTTAERHRLERNDICEIHVVSPMGETKRRFGRYMFTRGDGEMFFDTGREPFRVFEERVRSVRKVTPEYVATQFYPGQRVSVRKYGSDYGGRVIACGRRRIKVAFTTKGGKAREQSFPAHEVVPVG